MEKRYKVDNVKNYSHMKGWICGQFFPEGSVQKTSDLEVKFSTIMPGEKHIPHKHPFGAEISLVIKGSLKYLVGDEIVYLKDGDFVYMSNNITEAILEVYEPTIMVSAHGPSVPNNKITLDDKE